MKTQTIDSIQLQRIVFFKDVHQIMLIVTNRDSQLTARFGERKAERNLDGWTVSSSVYLTVLLSTAKATHALFYAD